MVGSGPFQGLVFQKEINESGVKGKYIKNLVKKQPFSKLENPAVWRESAQDFRASGSCLSPITSLIVRRVGNTWTCEYVVYEYD